MKNMCGGNMSRGKCPAQWNCMQRYNVCSLPFPQVHAATKFCSLQDAAALHTLTAPVHHRLVHCGCLNRKWSRSESGFIRIRVSDGLLPKYSIDSFPCRRQLFRRVSWKAASNCMRSANKTTKMSYSAMVREVEKWYVIRNRFFPLAARNLNQLITSASNPADRHTHTHTHPHTQIHKHNLKQNIPTSLAEAKYE